MGSLADGLADGLADFAAALPTAALELARATPDLIETGLIGVDAQGRICLWNRWIAQRSGVEASLAMGRDFAQVFEIPLDARMCAAVRGALERGLPARFSHALHPHSLPLRGLDDGALIQQKVSVLPVPLSGGTRSCLIQVVDMSEVVRREALLRQQARELATKFDRLIQTQGELQRSESRFRELAGSAPVGIFETDAGGSCIFVNEHWSELTGLSLVQASGSGWLEVLEPEDRASLVEDLAIAAAGARRVCRDLRLRNRQSGEARWIRVDATPMRDAQGVPTGFISTAMDVHREREAAQRDAFAAQHDALTGLVNRARFDCDLERAIDSYHLDAEPFAIMYFDLDGFKAINDEFGHDVGDVVLRVVAGRLRQALRRSDIVARLGGDEFVALLFGVRCEEDLTVALAKTEQLLSVPIDHGELILHARCSVGTARFPTHAMDAASLLRHADQSMYECKRARRAGLGGRAIQPVNLA
jgi:diguanylate cyclase (GGDEF)-like protein/PAS domain S-box-containing protein